MKPPRLEVLLAVAVAAVGGLEVALRQDLPSRPGALGAVAVTALAVLMRRRHPLGALALGFGLALATTLVEWHLGWPEAAPFTQGAILLLPYAVARWGTRVDALAGAALLGATWLASLLKGEMPQLADVVGSAVVLLFPGALGGVARFRAEAQARALVQAQLLERERLARELHDSVAHHLVAITLQSQAARAVLAQRPDEAGAALAAIEDESRRTLAELRALVGVLRDTEDGPRAPEGRLVDLPALAERTARPRVEVRLEGDLSNLEPALERALYRLAQESVTNALKHARNASHVEVHITAAGPSVHLRTRDDGQGPAGPPGQGFGLVGMAERAALLEGTFRAGPAADGGWQVEATLPRGRGQR